MTSRGRSLDRTSDGHRAVRGFTLIEIMLVLAVLGLLGGVLAMSMDGLTQLERLRAAARSIAGMSDFVRAASTGTQRSTYLDIDLDLHRYRFRQDPVRDPYGRAIDPEDESLMNDDDILEWEKSYEYEDLPTGVYFKSVFVSTELHWTEGPVVVEYLPTGTLQSTIIHLQTAKDDSGAPAQVYSVVINGLTGKSEVQDYEVHFTEAREADFSDVMGEDAPGARKR